MQQSLLGAGEPTVDTAFRDLERIWLDDMAWIDVVRGWIGGSGSLFDDLRRTVRWRQDRRSMWDREVDVPRLTVRFDGEQDPPVMARVMARALTRRYGHTFDRLSASLYRDGNDSVAWHRDRGVRDSDDAAVAIVSLGGPRTLAVRPLGGGPAVASVTFGWGDLLVMGGTSNRDYEHAVPKCAHAEPRIALMFRHACGGGAMT